MVNYTAHYNLHQQEPKRPLSPYKFQRGFFRLDIPIVVTLPQAVPSITLLPIDKLNAVLAGIPSEYGAVEICQQFIRFA